MDNTPLEKHMKQYALFYDNQEMGTSGCILTQSNWFPDWLFDLWDSLNPETTITLVEI